MILLLEWNACSQTRDTVLMASVSAKANGCCEPVCLCVRRAAHLCLFVLVLSNNSHCAAHIWARGSARNNRGALLYTGLKLVLHFHINVLIYLPSVRTAEQISGCRQTTGHRFILEGIFTLRGIRMTPFLCLCRGHDVQTQGQQRNKTEISPLTKLARGARRVQWTEKRITMSASASPKSSLAVFALRVGHGEAWPLRGKIEYEMKMASCMWSVRNKCSDGLWAHCVPLNCVLELCQISQIR